MAQTLSLHMKGLITNPNTLNMDGALSYADNVVISKDNIVESRRGYNKFNQYLSLGCATGTISSLFNYQDEILVHYDDKIAIDDGSGDWDDYPGTFEAPDTGFRIRSLEQNQNLYITTTEGIQKLSSTDGTFENSGIVRSLDGTGSVTGSTGWFEDDSSVSYRVLWGKYDENKNLILGAPSARLVVGNGSGGTRDVELTFTIPAGITTDYFYQIYRSAQTEAILNEPNEELQLVYEAKPTSDQIAAKEFIVKDSLADALKDATIYTAPSQQGISNANEPPPFAKDMTVFKDHVFFANTKTKHRLTLSLLGTGASGLAVGDTFTVDSITYTGATATSVENDEFYVSTTGTPATDIQDTALSLVEVINKSASNTGLYTYYTSGYEDVPGRMLFERRSLSADSFSAISSAGEAFTPEIPSEGTNNDSVSDNEVKQNRVYISKQQQPESVPFLSYLNIGSANEPIKRIISLRDSIFVFKDDGVFKITGESVSSFRVTVFDENTKLLAPESAVTFNNTIFCMTLQGVVSISDGGVPVVSRQIEQQLLKLIQYTNFNNSTFAVSYESERQYILYCIASENQEYPTQAYVYNSFSNAWTRWSYNATCGFINNEDDKLYYGGKLVGYSDAWVHKERKAFTSDDYVDDDWGILIQTVDSTTVLEVNRTDDCVVGYWIRQFLSQEGTYNTAKITAINTGTRKITVSPAISTWSNDPINPTTIYKPITCRVKWVANTAGNPSVMKTFRDATLFFRQDTAATLKIGYETNFQPGYDYTEDTTVDVGNWGNFSFGTIPWDGLDDTFSQPIRVGVPRNKAKCLWISFSVEGSNAFSSFSLAGISATFEPITEKYQWTPS